MRHYLERERDLSRSSRLGAGTRAQCSAAEGRGCPKDAFLGSTPILAITHTLHRSLIRLCLHPYLSQVGHRRCQRTRGHPASPERQPAAGHIAKQTVPFPPEVSALSASFHIPPTFLSKQQAAVHCGQKLAACVTTSIIRILST